MSAAENSQTLTDIGELAKVLKLAHPAPSAPPPPIEPDPREVLGDQVLHTVLWLAANNAMLPAQALAGIGLGDGWQEWLADHYMQDLEDLRLLQLAARSMTQPMVGRLLRGRLVGQALSATTAQQLAAVTRAFRALPDWAWEEEERAEGTRQKAQVAEQVRQMPHDRGGSSAKVQGGNLEGQPQSSSSALPVEEEPRLNRAARRRLEKLQAKAAAEGNG